jgi:probable phosphoglycerate mutase
MKARLVESNFVGHLQRRQVLLSGLALLYICSFLVTLVAAFAGPDSGQPAQPLRILLARHGQTDWNFERRLQGSTDIALNSTGLIQAATLAERLTGIHLDMVYCSALRRSRDTAEIARGAAPLKSLAGLNERGVGKFEGRWLDRTKDPETVEEYPKRSRDPDDELDGGESWNQFYARVRAAFSEIRSRHSSGTILIVAHAGTNQMILREILGLSLERALAIKQANDELYSIEVAGPNRPRLWKLIAETNLGEL